MVARTKWTLRVERLPTRLAVGRAAVPVEVSLVIHGLFEAQPEDAADAFDLAGLVTWITGAWSRSPAAPLLEVRVNELIEQVFEGDPRVQDVQAAVFRVDAKGGTVGVERQASRAQHKARLRLIG